MILCRSETAIPLALLLLWPAAALAVDPPHWAGGTELDVTCTSNCHIPHKASGMAITQVAGNRNLCESCHSFRPGTDAGTGPFGFPWTTDHQAVPNSKGHSHRWDALATNPSYGALPPLHPAMVLRLEGGKIMCSTCHDQHNGATLNQAGATQHTSYRVGAANRPLGWDGGSTAIVTLEQPAAASASKAYVIQIAIGGAVGTATYRVSNDNGRSFYGWNGSAWEAGNTAGRPTAASGAILNDGTNVKVAFSGALWAGDRWRFYVSYPFMRIQNDSSQLCEQCHRDRVMDAGSVECCGDGGQLFSHPVGEALGRSYDRQVGGVPQPLDSHGGLQDGGGDGNATNDLRFFSNYTVRCMTCHYPHNADSNSLTEDAR